MPITVEAAVSTAREFLQANGYGFVRLESVVEDAPSGRWTVEFDPMQFGFGGIVRVTVAPGPGGAPRVVAFAREARVRR